MDRQPVGKLRAALTVRQRPGEFRIDAEASGGWLIAGKVWKRNPLFTVPAEIFAIVDLWMLTRAHGGAMGGRMLPCAGAPADQPAALIDAFMLLDAWASEKDG